MSITLYHSSPAIIKSPLTSDRLLLDSGSSAAKEGLLEYIEWTVWRILYSIISKIGCAFRKRAPSWVDPPEEIKKCDSTGGNNSNGASSKEHPALRIKRVGTRYLHRRLVSEGDDNIAHPKETTKVYRTKDADGNKMVNKYLLVKEVGRGTYGKVKLCLHTEENIFYAVKILRKSYLQKKRIGLKKGGAVDDAKREIAILKTLCHPNVVKLYEVIEDPDDDHLYLIFEYAEGGAIMGPEIKTEPLPVDVARKYFYDIVCGLEYLHSQKVIHRDIKPENLLLDKDGRVKISDFGVSIRLVGGDTDEEMLKKTVGSPAFLAPELCASDVPKIRGPPIDIWSLGVTLYYCIFGCCPFIGPNEILLYEAIRTQRITFPRKVDSSLKDLLTKLLNKNPDKRPSIADIKKHSWLKGMAKSC